jgi:hypothetical protein
MLRRVGTGNQLIPQTAEIIADFVEILTTPLGSMLSSVATNSQRWFKLGMGQLTQRRQSTLVPLLHNNRKRNYENPP